MANLPDKYIAVIEDTDEARDAYGHAHGSIELSLGARQIRALEDGKAVASFDGEYVTYITFKAPVAANACDVPLSREAEIRGIRQVAQQALEHGEDYAGALQHIRNSCGVLLDEAADPQEPPAADAV